MLKPHQIKHIHALKRELGMHEAEYREMLCDGFGVVSCIELDVEQADQLIDSMRAKTGRANTFSERHSQLGHRPGKASAAQLRKLEAMWADVSRVQELPARDLAFARFLQKRFAIGALNWVKDTDVPRIIRALTAMKADKERKAKEAPHVD